MHRETIGNNAYVDDAFAAAGQYIITVFAYRWVMCVYTYTRAETMCGPE